MGKVYRNVETGEVIPLGAEILHHGRWIPAPWGTPYRAGTEYAQGLEKMRVLAKPEPPAYRELSEYFEQKYSDEKANLYYEVAFNLTYGLCGSHHHEGGLEGSILKTLLCSAE